MRGRKVEQLKHIDKHDFAKISKTKGSPGERRRFLAFAHIQDGKSFSESARMVKSLFKIFLAVVKQRLE